MNKFANKFKDLFLKIRRIYVLIDNIEELTFKDNFLSMFYSASKRELEFLKISFFFIGMNHPERYLSDE